MARAALDWSRKELACRAALGMETIYRFENGRKPHPESIAKLRSTFEAAGVLFLENTTGVGVILRHPSKDLPDPA
jgi:transcriptional regulator with XRE-family HTH domain